MNKLLKPLYILPFVWALGGCVNDDIAKLNDTPTPTASVFQTTLVNEYKRATDYEANSEGERDHAEGFALKGLAAAHGDKVLPEDGVTSYFKVAPANPDINASRARLMEALETGGRDLTPVPCAKAQVKFDEWVEEVAEGEPGKFERLAFLKLMDGCQGKAVPAPVAAEPPPAPIQPQEFIIYFAFDSAKLDASAEQIVKNVIDYARDHGDARISLAGHTDLAGTADYNVRLSLRRADAVRAELLAQGITGDRINVTALGESQPAVPTKKGVREARNRRVVVDLK